MLPLEYSSCQKIRENWFLHCNTANVISGCYRITMETLWRSGLIADEGILTSGETLSTISKRPPNILHASMVTFWLG